MFMFGVQRYTLDEKGRVRIPARFLEELGDRPVLSPGVGGRANIMSADMFFKQHPQLHDPNFYDVAEQDRSTALFSKSCELEPDTQGRVILPQGIVKLLEIKKEVVLVGKLTYVELWAAEEYDSRDELIDKASITKLLSSFGSVVEKD